MMDSTFGRETYEKGYERGLELGLEKGLQHGMGNGLSSILIKLLTKRFGILPKELKDQIRQLDVETLDFLLGGVMEYQNLEEVKQLMKP